MTKNWHIFAQNVMSLTDARYFAAFEAEYLCFSCNPEEAAFIAPNIILAIAGWTEGAKLAGSFGTAESDEKIRSLAAALNLQAVVLQATHNFSSLTDLPLILDVKISANDAFSAEGETKHRHFLAQQPTLSGFILDFENQQVDYSILNLYAAAAPTWAKNVGIDETTFSNYTRFAPDLRGFVLEGSVEEAVGVKDFEYLEAAIEIITQER